MTGYMMLSVDFYSATCFWVRKALVKRRFTLLGTEWGETSPIVLISLNIRKCGKFSQRNGTFAELRILKRKLPPELELAARCTLLFCGTKK
jgi:hypothetical protein